MQRTLLVIGRILASVGQAMASVWRYWMRDIASRRSCVGKAASLGIGLFVLCCGASAIVGGTRAAGESVGLVATRTPTSSPTRTASPLPTSTAAPTHRPQPTSTTAPTSTLAPTSTAIWTATAVPTKPLPPSPSPQPQRKEPTAVPTRAAQPAAPVVQDAGAYPCQPGQIKGNRNSGIYHAPGMRDYERTYKNVQCFDSEAEARAAGYRRAKR